MPGSTRSASRSTRARTPVLAEEDDDNPDNGDKTSLPRPSWDTADHTLPQFLTDLIKWLTKKDRRYARLVRNGTVLSGRYTIYLSLNHIDRVSTASVTEGSFAAPCAIKATDVVPFVVDSAKGSEPLIWARRAIRAALRSFAVAPPPTSAMAWRCIARTHTRPLTGRRPSD